MKKTRIALAVSASLLATSAMATNGTNMIGVGAQANALGGTGTAAYFGAESVIVNPGLIGKGEGTQFSFGGTLFKPTVTNDGGNASAGKSTSSADTNVIPSVALTSRINDSLTFGIGMFGTSGMGVDYSNESNPALAGTMKAQSQMQIMKFVPTLAYNQANFGIGFSPVIQYGSLDINYKNPQNTQAGYSGTGYGAASDLGMGFNLGGYFDITKDFTIAASYESAISMKYDGQLSTASTPFTQAQGGPLASAFDDTLEQPAQIKLGAAYTMGNITLTGDFKQIKWGDAKGYKDFGWEDQNVIAIGGKYAGDGFWLGAGFNKADNPIKSLNFSTPTAANAVTGTYNLFNNLFFPATTEQHFTFGGGYSLTKNVAMNAAVVIAPEVKTSANFVGRTNPTNPATSYVGTNTTTHSQIGYTVDVSYKF